MFVRVLIRLADLIFYIAIATVIAGLFGIIHDQITWSVSEEYYTRFKFIQFGFVDSPLPFRARVGVIGVLATWMVGLIVGVVLGSIAMLFQDRRTGRRLFFRGLLIVFTIVIFTDIVGFLYGLIQTTDLDLSAYQDWFVPDDLIEPRRFILTGYIHNASYLGGAIGTMVAAGYLIQQRVREFRMQASDRSRDGKRENVST